MNFNKKSLTISFVICIFLFFFTLVTPVLNPIFASLIILFVYYFLLYWQLDFDIQPIGFLNILLLSGFYIQSFTMFILTISKVYEVNIVVLLGLITALFLAIQVVNRNANITNVSSIKKIPLFQVSQSFNYILTVFSIFVSIFTLQINDATLWFFWMYSLVIIIISIASNLSLIERIDKRVLYSYSVISVVINFLFLLLLTFIDINPIIRSVITSLVCFSLLGNYFTNLKQNKMSAFNTMQFIVLFILILSLLVFFINR